MRRRIGIAVEVQVDRHEDIEREAWDLAAALEVCATDFFPDAHDVIATVMHIEEVGE